MLKLKCLLDAISANALNLPQTSSTRPAVAQVTGCKTQGQIALTYVGVSREWQFWQPTHLIQ